MILTGSFAVHTETEKDPALEVQPRVQDVGDAAPPAPRINIIVAMSENRVIGVKGKLPWHLPADLQRFKTLTTGRTLIMGRRTFDSIGKPLPKRRSIVITRNPQWSHQGVDKAHSLGEALDQATAEPELFIIGGEQIYRLALPWAQRLYLTLVHTQVQGDALFPTFPLEAWQLVSREHHPADDRHAHAMTFLHYERRQPLRVPVTV